VRIFRPLSLLTLIALLGAGSVIGWRLSGGQLYTMSSPSMCPQVCVGSLIGARPATYPLKVGDTIVFREPASDAIYTHRVYSVSPAGLIRTIANSSNTRDVWTLTDRNVLGQVTFTVWGLGWLYEAGSFLLAGLMLLILCRLVMIRDTARGFSTMWLTALIVLPLVRLRPLVRSDITQAPMPARSLAPHHSSWLAARVANTGLLPARFNVAGGPLSPRVAPGQFTTVIGPARHGSFFINQQASLLRWGWLLVALIILAPLGAITIRQLRHRPTFDTTSLQPERILTSPNDTIMDGAPFT
jgi:hypothetical protein